MMKMVIHAVILSLNRRRHFTTVFKVCSHLDPQKLDFIEQRPVFEMIAAIPTNNDVVLL